MTEPSPLQRRSWPLEHRTTDLEYQVFGADGDSGMKAEIRTIKAEKKANEHLLRTVVFWGLIGVIVVLSTALISGRDAAIALVKSVVTSRMGP